MSPLIHRRDFLRQCARCAIACAAWDVALFLDPRARAESLPMKKGLLGRKLSPYYTSLGDGVVRCDLCPHQCEVAPGERGQCRVRENIEGKYYSLVYGNPCAVHVDPIEKKPFFHVLPASRSFSIATAGCNFTCKFCQNWEISQASPDETHNYDLPPDKVVEYALRTGCESIASTYVEPTIFMEYMLDIGREAADRGVLKVMHSCGYVNEKPLADLCRYLDAACIDLKGFTESYYREMSGGALQPVLDTLKRLKAHGVHTEIVNLMVPTKNDDPSDVREMCRWIFKELGPDVPLHFTRFYPMYRLKSLPPTPVGTLEKARGIALEEGLHYVYVGNVPGHPGESTVCPFCQKIVVKRRGYRIESVELKEGRCRFCGRPVAGLWKSPSRG